MSDERVHHGPVDARRTARPTPRQNSTYANHIQLALVLFRSRNFCVTKQCYAIRARYDTALSGVVQARTVYSLTHSMQQCGIQHIHDRQDVWAIARSVKSTTYMGKMRNGVCEIEPPMGFGDISLVRKYVKTYVLHFCCS